MPFSKTTRTFGLCQRRLLPGALIVCIAVSGFGGIEALAQGTAAPAGVATPVPATTAPAAAPKAPAGAVSLQTLLDRASFWRGRGRTDLALDQLEQILTVDPANAEALYQAGLVAVEAGDGEKAQAYLARLSAVAPNDARVERLTLSIRRGKISEELIAQARAASTAGDGARAVEIYRSAFAGLPPPLEYAVEYYQALSSTEAGWAEARERLGAMAERNPSDERLQIVYAKTLTFREVTRREGIARLARLAPKSEEADKAWRDALGWLSYGTADEALLRDYLARHPNDADMTARLTKLTEPMKPDSADNAVQLAYEAVAAKHYVEAEKLFLIALGFDANDTRALTGMAGLLMQRGRTSEARTYLDRAIAVEPALKEQYADLYRASQFVSSYGAASAAARAGRLSEAERILRPLVGGGYKEGRLAQALLANVLERQGKLGEAERLYRGLLKSRPGDKEATAGLYRVLIAQKRLPEAQALADRVPERLRAQTAQALSAAEADALAKQAEAAARSGDLAGARRTYLMAIEKQPDNAWLRLGCARIMLRLGDAREADALMSTAVAGAEPKPEALHAAALYAIERGRLQDAASLLARIPGKSRTADIRRLSDEVALKSTLAAARAAKAAGNEAQARSIFEDLARRTDLSMAMKGEIASALADLGDRPGALAMARKELARPIPKGANFGDYAGLLGVLARDGSQAELSAALDRLGPLARSAEDRRQVADVQSGLIATRADQARQDGRLEEAWGMLSAALKADPANETLQAAMARVYADAKMYDVAARIYDHLLQRRPGDRDLTLQAVWVAMGNGDNERARDLIDPLLDGGWQSSQLYYADGLLARAEGDTAQAIASLEKARQLRASEIGVDPSALSVLPETPGPTRVNAGGTYPPLQ